MDGTKVGCGGIHRVTEAQEQLDRTILLCRDYVAPDVPDADIRRALQSTSILCVCNEEIADSLSAQTALFTLVSLLGRMGMQVGVRTPRVRMVGLQPPFPFGEIPSSLVALSDSLISGASIQEATTRLSADIVFVLGCSAFPSDGAPTWYLTGDNWSGGITTDCSRIRKWVARLPIGAMVSATLAAGEAFKAAMRRLRLRSLADAIWFTACEHCHFTFGNIETPLRDLDLGQVDLISAGAITQAALFALARIPTVRFVGRVFDDDTTASSNLNRNMLTLSSDVGTLKTIVVARQFELNIKIEPVNRKFGTGDGAVQLSNRVLVGVDDIPSRWSVQRSVTGWVGVGGTSHFSVSSSAHPPQAPCSGCLHPLDDRGDGSPIPTVSFVSFWAGLSLAVRYLREAIGKPYSADKQHLWLTPLRLDQPHAALWIPVAARQDCPVRCSAAQQLYY